MRWTRLVWISGVIHRALLEVLDPEQNFFSDHYLEGAFRPVKGDVYCDGKYA